MTTIGVKHDQVVRYSKRKKVKVDYTMYDTLTMKKDEAFIKTLLDQKFKEANVQRYEGKDITKSFLRQHGFRVPFLAVVAVFIVVVTIAFAAVFLLSVVVSLLLSGESFGTFHILKVLSFEHVAIT